MDEIVQHLAPLLKEISGYIYPNEIELHWGLLVVLYPYLTGLVAGAFILASLVKVFNVKELQPVYRISLLSALAYLMVAPPAEGSASHARYVQERDGILADLHAKATRIRAAFEGMEGMRCFGRIGAMYLFPRMEKLPEGTTDFDYCMSLLEATGLCTVNGSGFGQKPGTHHLRIAFLPPAEVLDEVLPRWTEFHNAYV